MQPHQNVTKCWFFVVLLGLGCVGGVHTISSVSGERYTGPVVMVIDLVGQKQCIQKCQERPSVCKGVNYSRQNLLCELVSATEKTERRPEYVRVTLDVVSNYISLIFLPYLLKQNVNASLGHLSKG